MHIVENNVDFLIAELSAEISQYRRKGRTILQTREIHTFYELSALIEQHITAKVTGELVVHNGENVGSIYLTEGAVVWVTASSARPSLFDMLEEKGNASRDALIAACEVSIAAGANLAEQLVIDGILPKELLMATLKKHLAYPLSEIIRWNAGVVEFHPHSSLGWSSFRFKFGELMGRALMLLDHAEIFTACNVPRESLTTRKGRDIPMISDPLLGVGCEDHPYAHTERTCTSQATNPRVSRDLFGPASPVRERVALEMRTRWSTMDGLSFETCSPIRRET